MLNNVKSEFCFLLFRTYFIFFCFKFLNFDFKSSHSSFYVMTVCLICVFCTKERLNYAKNRMILGKPSETDSARLGHIPSLPCEPQLPLKPCLSLQPLDLKGNCGSFDSLSDFCFRLLYSFICSANVGYSPTPRQHF